MRCLPPSSRLRSGRRCLPKARADSIPKSDQSATKLVVTKHRVSAFAGTDLEMILRAGEIDTLVLTGIATSGVVLSTLLDAADADYRLAVVNGLLRRPRPGAGRLPEGAILPDAGCGGGCRGDGGSDSAAAS